LDGEVVEYLAEDEEAGIDVQTRGAGIGTAMAWPVEENQADSGRAIFSERKKIACAATEVVKADDGREVGWVVVEGS